MTECRHEPWQNDVLFTPDYKGGGRLGGVYIKNPAECRRCGHIVTWSEAMAAALQALNAQASRAIAEFR